MQEENHAHTAPRTRGQQPKQQPEQLPLDLADEPVWRILLERWELPGLPVVCRLLACSRSMAAVVHSMCAGRVVGELPLSGPDRREEATVQARWLAKHGRLLHTLKVREGPGRENPAGDGMEALLAAGLQAAAGPAAGGASDSTADGASLAANASRVTRSQAAALGDVAAAAQAAAAGGLRPPGLLLQSVDLLLGASDGSLLCALAGCGQLTRLQLPCGLGAAAVPACADALAQLRSLQSLWMGMEGRPVDALAPALHHFTGLTTLDVVLQSGSGTAQPGSGHPGTALPASLLELNLLCEDAGGAWRLRHLTRLTRLELHSLAAGDELPAGLQELHVSSLRSAAPLRALPALRLLEVAESVGPLMVIEGLDEVELFLNPTVQSPLQELAAVTQLQDLRLCCYYEPFDEVSRHLAALPLTHFEAAALEFKGEHVGQLASWKRLTCFAAQCCSFECSPERLAAIFAGLPALRELELNKVHVAATEGDAPQGRYSEMQDDELAAVAQTLAPLFEGLAGMPGLRALHLATIPVQAGVAALARATQLTSLKVGGGCWLDAASAVVLRAGLKDVPSLVLTEGPDIVR